MISTRLLSERELTGFHSPQLLHGFISHFCKEQLRYRFDYTLKILKLKRPGFLYLVALTLVL